MTSIRGLHVQLVGPVTGIDRISCEAAFQAAKAVCLRHGAREVWSPVEHVRLDATHAEAMRVCLRRIVEGKTDALVMLEGWEDSEGALVEAAVADAVGVPRLEITEVGA